MGMEILGSLFRYHISKGHIQGLKIAWESPVLTHLMYADDLLIFGQANQEELLGVMGILNHFCAMSGQHISPEKSRLWLSKITSASSTQLVCQSYGAPLASPHERYLGAQF